MPINTVSSLISESRKSPFSLQRYQEVRNFIPFEAPSSNAILELLSRPVCPKVLLFLPFARAQ